MPTVQTNKLDGSVRSRRTKDQLVIEQDWHFRILADSLDQDRTTILYSTPGVPQFNVQYGTYGMFLKGADAERNKDDPLLWEAVYHLSNVVEEGSNRNPATGDLQTGDPTTWIPWYDLGFEDYDEVFRRSLDIQPGQRHQDLGGNDPVGYNATRWTNSVGKAYESGFVRQKRIITRKFTQFDALTGPGAVTLDDIEERNNVINDRTYLGKPKRTLLLTVDAATVGVYYGRRCIKADYTLHYKKDDWRLKQMDVSWEYANPQEHPNGIDQLNPPNPIKTIPYMVDGQPSLVALNGRGQIAPNQFSPAPRYFKEYEDANFASFLRLI